MDAQTTLQAKLQTECAILRSYSQSECSKTLLKILDMLIESYKMDLIHVKPEGLVSVQSAIAQTIAIRNVVADESKDSPKI
jgi:hypothetical protein